MRIVKKHVLFMLVVSMVFSLFSASAFAQGHSANDPAALSKARQAVDDVIKDRAKSVAKLNLRNMNIQRDPLLNEAPAFYASISGKSYDELTSEEQEKLINISKKAREMYNGIEAYVNGGNSGGIQPQGYLDTQLSKAIEAAIYAGFPTLSAGDIAISFLNANEARDIGVRYAQYMGWSETWDNPADAYRHFAWNWFNTRDMSANKARVFGDYHELALAAATALENTNLTFDEKVAAGILLAFEIRSNTQQSLANFNTFDNATVMDIYNNSWGRKYYVNYSYSNVADAFYDALYVHENLVGWTSDVNSSIRSLAYSYWQ